MRITNETAAAAAYAQALSGVQSYPSASGTGRARVQSGSFDQVDISQESSGESRFRKELAARLVQDVRASASTGSIQQLREQVRSGAYRAEPESIAAAILLEVRA